MIKKHNKKSKYSLPIVSPCVASHEDLNPKTNI